MCIIKEAECQSWEMKFKKFKRAKLLQRALKLIISGKEAASWLISSSSFFEQVLMEQDILLSKTLLVLYVAT